MSRRRRSRGWRLGCVVAAMVFAVVAGIPGTAWAHNKLRVAQPGDKTSLATAPQQVTLDFSERLDPAFTTVAVTDAAGSAVTQGGAQVSGTTAVQPLVPSLSAGTYTVAYRVVSVDGHPVLGSLTFTVLPSATPSATSSLSAAASTPVPSAPAEQRPASNVRNDSGGAGWIVAAALSLAVVAVVGAVVVRRRRRAE